MDGGGGVFVLGHDACCAGGRQVRIRIRCTAGWGVRARGGGDGLVDDGGHFGFLVCAAAAPAETQDDADDERAGAGACADAGLGAFAEAFAAAAGIVVCAVGIDVVDLLAVRVHYDGGGAGDCCFGVNGRGGCCGVCRGSE